MPDIAPDVIASQAFRTVLRGYDPAEVRGFLRGVSDGLNALVEERDRLAAKLGLADPADLKREIQVVSRQIEEVLESARAAADEMRERAAAEAARWRSESLAEAERARREAQADAEHLRTDAWTTSEALLGQVQREVEHLHTQAEKESMRLVGEAEREAHRILGTGRREAEETVRSARMAAEKLVLDARKEHDEIIDTAHKEAEVSQARARALEQRRDELRRELESVRDALSSAETELDERRESMGLSETQVAGSPDDPESWTPGETVRVVKPGQPTARGGADPVSSDPRVSPEPTPELRVLSAAELRAMRQPSHEPAETATGRVSEPTAEPEQESEDSDPIAGAGPAPGPADDMADDEGAAHAPEVPAVTDVDAADMTVDRAEAFTAAAEVEEVATDVPDPVLAPSTFRLVDAPRDQTSPPDSGPVSVSEPTAETTPPTLADVEGLFARLREPAGTEPTATSESDHPRPTRMVGTVDPFDVRERLLLPISNRALRNLKRQLTEEQNAALEAVRLDPEDWSPDPEALRASLRADLVVLAAESFAAGHAAAETLVGDRLTRPSTPKSDPAAGFAAALAEDIGSALDDGRVKEHGARQLGADISRVFRAWRTDESERRLRDQAHAAFNHGVVDTLTISGITEMKWLVAGRGCAQCRERAAVGEVTDVEPVHDGCSCTVVPS